MPAFRFGVPVFPPVVGPLLSPFPRAVGVGKSAPKIGARLHPVFTALCLTVLIFKMGVLIAPPLWACRRIR